MVDRGWQDHSTGVGGAVTEDTAEGPFALFGLVPEINLELPGGTQLAVIGQVQPVPFCVDLQVDEAFLQGQKAPGIASAWIGFPSGG